ncbi:MAG TPA: exodeoxyribonuclease VII small subunit [Candidatus Saccharimonadales bacterium]|nr:exodeoxyribonuclease VII small subunit [Candidatus Saccharimonadales bacterium]
MQKPNTADYQTISSELDQVLAALQNPDVAIDDAVALYERGLALVKELETTLRVAENKITKLRLQAGEGQE